MKTNLEIEIKGIPNENILFLFNFKSESSYQMLTTDCIFSQSGTMIIKAFYRNSKPVISCHEA